MKLYHATLVFEEFVTGDRETQIDWAAIKKKVATLMRRLSPDFIGMGEIDVQLNKSLLVDGVSQGRVLCPHFHILFWTSEHIKTKILSKNCNSQAPPTFECYCQFYGESNLPFCACFFLSCLNSVAPG